LAAIIALLDRISKAKLKEVLLEWITRVGLQPMETTPESKMSGEANFFRVV
jgi:hypothetical protein